MFLKYSVLFAITVSLKLVSTESDLVVDAPDGLYEGHILQTRDGREVLAFQGIPYALPPVGKLRFKVSQLLT